VNSYKYVSARPLLLRKRVRLRTRSLKRATKKGGRIPIESQSNDNYMMFEPKYTVAIS
jgi:hypothetical protein